MLRAASLLYALVIIFLIGLLASSFVLFSYLHSRETDFYGIQYRLDKNAASGMEYLLAFRDVLPYQQPFVLELSDEPYDKVILEKKSWGLYEIGVAEATFKTRRASRICLIGAKAAQGNTTALYLVDTDKPLQLAGKTEIRGTAWLPEKGVKRAYIEAQHYAGEQLIYGTQKKSERLLPELPAGMAEQNHARLQGRFTAADSLLDFFALESDTLLHSFARRTGVFSTPAPLVLDKGRYEGNLIFHSSSRIVVKPGCFLSGVLLYAPWIEIESDNGSSFQAFASDSLRLKENSELRYPSALALLRKYNSVQTPSVPKKEFTLCLEQNTRMCGVLLGWTDKLSKQEPLLVSLDKQSILVGQIYSSDRAQIKGAVYGQVLTTLLYLHTAASKYENTLLDAVIDGTRLPEEFTGLSLKHESYRSRVVKQFYERP